VVGGSIKSNLEPVCAASDSALFDVRCCADEGSSDTAISSAESATNTATSPRFSTTTTKPKTTVAVTVTDAVPDSGEGALSCHAPGSCGVYQAQFVWNADNSVSYCFCDDECGTRSDCCSDYVTECIADSVTAPTPAPVCAGVEVDSSDVGAVVEIVGGDWETSFKGNRVVKGSFKMTVADPNHLHSVRFAPALGWTGDYDVYMSYRPSTTRVSNLQVAVTDQHGTHTTIVNQRQLPNQADATDIYRLLGTYSFVAGSAGSPHGVLIGSTGADAGQKIVVDSVKFVARCDVAEVAVAAGGTGDGAVQDLAALALGKGTDERAASLFALPTTQRGSDDSSTEHLFVGGVVVGVGLLVVVVFGILKMSTPALNRTNRMNGHVFDDRNVVSEAFQTSGSLPLSGHRNGGASGKQHRRDGGSPTFEWEEWGFTADGHPTSSASCALVSSDASSNAQVCSPRSAPAEPQLPSIPSVPTTCSKSERYDVFEVSAANLEVQSIDDDGVCIHAARTTTTAPNATKGMQMRRNPPHLTTQSSVVHL
jgi:hypothetical protein